MGERRARGWRAVALGVLYPLRHIAHTTKRHGGRVA
jgi:hypothetical protein